MSGVRETTLPSGLRVLTDPMDTVESASLGLWVDAGTRHEPAEINGISHLLEHMAFKGTERRSARAIAEEMDAVGGHLNAYTARDHTAYYAKVLKEDSALALDILADILQNSTVDAEELAREQAVVVQEINQSFDTPDDIIFDHFQTTAFPDQPLGRPVLGTEELVRAMSRDTVLGYMATHYSAPRMVLSAAGRIDHDQLVELAGKAFADLPTAADVMPAPALYKGGEYREERDIEQVNLVLGYGGVSYDDPDYYTASVLSTLLGGGMSSRLFQEIREKRGLVYSIYSFASSYADGGLFGIYAGTGEDEVEELVPVLCDEVVKITQGVDADELQRARAQLKASILMSLESTSSRCEQLARQVLVYGRPIPTQEVVDKVEAIDGAQIARVARRLFATPPTIAAIGPLSKLESHHSMVDRLKL
ncbi:M16 family metallopeptidase [Magnetospirillum gryphiswaldense]|uniref:Zn-dependent peptidases n=1 Tax=Magnetospirillum gryphiswaldense TaxID=55518 RepID=A4U064_9PROT|nr:pitrilysin family protein [Magnetospirillum gryphiswaldense]AVM75296.1 Protease 3 precursor [Magnetospirillum gryphiswaldense MSR-1]AVM79199.1 Protease 3 precursor [Magnetospirillum gryphiswaldense]CAM76271.1 Zn-dependent peptidases [Magnetospirillum gryphiswaldense MSR-1]